MEEYWEINELGDNGWFKMNILMNKDGYCLLRKLDMNVYGVEVCC